jgi:ribonuclease HI
MGKLERETPVRGSGVAETKYEERARGIQERALEKTKGRDEGNQEKEVVGWTFTNRDELSDSDTESADQIRWSPDQRDISEFSRDTSKIGGRLLEFLERWQSTCGGSWLLKNGFRIFWKSDLWKSSIECSGRKRAECWQRGERRQAMQLAVQEGLRTGVMQEIPQSAILLSSPSYMVPKAKGGYRQVIDLRILNMATKDISFKMEDTSMLMQIAREGDFATSLDIKSAFHHVPTNPSALGYLSFCLDEKTYTWKGMPFGAKHSPLIFTKIMRVVLKYIRKNWKIRCIGYMDDLLFLRGNKDVLKKITGEIAKYLEWLGWILSIEKCEMEPKQEMDFLGWTWNFRDMTVKMKKERRKGLRKSLKWWIKACQRRQVVKVRDVASLLGQVNFLRTQIPRVALYTTALNRAKVRGVRKGGWNGKMRMTYGELGELRVIYRWVEANTPREIVRRTPEATLTTDASGRGWGAELEVKGKTYYYYGEFGERNWNLTSSNQRESMAVLLALRACREKLLEKGVRAICIESDNTTTVSNLTKVRGAKRMVKIVRKIFSTLAEMEMEIMAKYRPGKENGVADALSRLETAGDYELREEVFLRGLMELKREDEREEQMVEIDLFATRWNHKTKRYVSPSADPAAEASDAFSISWGGWSVYAHPPINQIAKVLEKVEREKIETIIVVPKWPSQPWWPKLVELAERRVTLGVTGEIVIAGDGMKARRTKVPPGKLMMVRISWRE